MSRRQLLMMTLVLEGAMLVVALVLRAWLGLGGSAPLRISAAALGWGAGATVPPLLFLWWSTQTSWQPLRRLHTRVLQMVRVTFAHARIVDIVLVSFLAGLAEELLFRGVLQAWLVGQVGFVGAVLIASIAFGLAHPVSRAYVAAVVGIGLYLGALLQYSGNLVLPIVVHALYDLIALLVLVRAARRGLEVSGSEGADVDSASPYVSLEQEAPASREP